MFSGEDISQMIEICQNIRLMEKNYHFVSLYA